MFPKLQYGQYLGQTQRALEFADFSLRDVTYVPGQDLRPHAHEHAILAFNLLGDCSERVGTYEWHLGPSMLRYHPPDEVHADRIGGGGWRVFTIEFTVGTFERLRDERAMLDRPVILEDIYLTTLGRRLYREFRTADDVAALAIEALVLEIAGEAARRDAADRERRVPRWLRLADEALRTQFIRPPALPQLAREVGVHPVHLARVFHRVFGQTIGDHVRSLRVDFACRRMRDRHLPLSTIALLAGFADQSHFCRTFRRMVGMTPSQYRNLFADGTAQPAPLRTISTSRRICSTSAAAPS